MQGCRGIRHENRVSDRMAIVWRKWLQNNSNGFANEFPTIFEVLTIGNITKAGNQMRAIHSASPLPPILSYRLLKRRKEKILILCASLVKSTGQEEEIIPPFPLAMTRSPEACGGEDHLWHQTVNTKSRPKSSWGRKKAVAILFSPLSDPWLLGDDSDPSWAARTEYPFCRWCETGKAYNLRKTTEGPHDPLRLLPIRNDSAPGSTENEIWRTTPYLLVEPAPHVYVLVLSFL